MQHINLSAGVRSNLLSLQNTAALLERTQTRLSTGQKVNGPLDNPAAFFTAQGLNARANDLTSLVTGKQNAIKTITAASKGIEALTNTMESMLGMVRQAMQDPNQSVNRKNFLVNSGMFTDVSISLTWGEEVHKFTAGELELTGDQAERTTKIANAINNSSSLNELGVTASVVGDPGGEELQIENASGRIIEFTGADAAAMLGNGNLNVLVVADDKSNFADSRRTLMNQFNELRTEFDAIARDATFNGNNILMGGVINLAFNELTGASRNSFEVRAKKADGEAFGPVNADRIIKRRQGDAPTSEGVAETFASNHRLGKLATSMQAGMSELRSLSQQLGTSQTIIENRQNFTKELINTLRAGADGLILADMNEEAANNLALQTKQQIGQSALSLAIRSDQSILDLLR